jgi:hypothetical protein
MCTRLISILHLRVIHTIDKLAYHSCAAEVKGICYYSMQDISLGQFLRDRWEKFGSNHMSFIETGPIHPSITPEPPMIHFFQ